MLWKITVRNCKTNDREGQAQRSMRKQGQAQRSMLKHGSLLTKRHISVQ